MYKDLNDTISNWRGLKRIAFYAVLFVANIGVAAQAATPSSSNTACDKAARQVARESGVPEDVLRAISLAETGRKRDNTFQTWPWTVNTGGKGYWFETRTQAETFAQSYAQTGSTNFDSGCFQLNFKWHGEAFPSIAAMFDPIENARYAARFLHDLYLEKGNWSEAAGAYHSRTKEFAERYALRFEAHRRNLDIQNASAPEIAYPALTQRKTQFPLIIAGGVAGRMGSLVPLDAAPVGRLIAVE